MRTPIVFLYYSSRSEMAVRALAETLRKRQVQVYAYPFELDENGVRFSKALAAHPEDSVVLFFAFGSSVHKNKKFSKTFQHLAKEGQRKSREVVTIRLETQPPSVTEEREAKAAFDFSGAADYEAELKRLLAHLGAVVERQVSKRNDQYSHVSGVLEATIPQSMLFAELQRQIIEGRIDQKYLYWDVRAALRWQAIAEASTYMTAQTSMNILAAHGPEMLRDFRFIANSTNYTFMNFGVGTGVKDFLILEQLLKSSSDARVLYIPIDESLPMMHITILQMQELMGTYGDRLKIHFVLDDFKNSERFGRHITQEENSWFGGQSPARLVGLLGGSLGNFQEKSILKSIRHLMPHSDDCLLLGVEFLGNRTNEELAANYEDQKMKEFLYGPILDVEAGQPDWNRDVYNAVVDNKSDVPDSRTIVGYARHARGPIQLFSATKYNRQELEDFLGHQGFGIVSTYTTEELAPKFGKYVLNLNSHQGG